MKFQFSEKKVKLPGNVHAYAEKKVMKLARYFEEDATALIVFSVEKNRNNVELTVHGAGTWFRARESTSDMFASIDAAVGTIEGQIRKNKTRLARRLRQDAFVRTADETSFAPEEKEEFVAILMPSQATHYNTVVATSDTWQLTANGARSFRELVKEDFWCELSRFTEDCNYRARLAGEKVTREEILSDFITMYNVPMTCYENLLRYETRHRVSATTHIEKKRNALETQTGNRFMYT